MCRLFSDHLPKSVAVPRLCLDTHFQQPLRVPSLVPVRFGASLGGWLVREVSLYPTPTTFTAPKLLPKSRLNLVAKGVSAHAGWSAGQLPAKPNRK